MAPGQDLPATAPGLETRNDDLRSLHHVEDSHGADGLTARATKECEHSQKKNRPSCEHLTHHSPPPPTFEKRSYPNGTIYNLSVKSGALFRALRRLRASHKKVII